MIIREYIDSFLELIYPEKNCCQICGEVDDKIGEKYICKGCFKKLRLIKFPVCKVCGKSLSTTPEQKLCQECIRNPKSFYKNRSPFRYKGIIKKILHDYKYLDKPYYFKMLGYFLYQYIQETNYTDYDFITTVPLHNIKLRKRGYNQAELIAKYLAKKLSIPYIDTLKRVKNTTKQSNLSKEDRARNLKNVFEIKSKNTYNKIRGKKILIVDDIYTTGATINECSSVLTTNGANRVYSITVAR